MNKNLCIAIIGPTASGKSSLALQIAPHLNGEIICMDSTTIYRGFNIGASKPTAEDQAKVPHHLLDILNPNEPFSAYHFVQRTEEAIEEISARGKLPIIVGGTYFYLRALQKGMYPSPPVPAEVIEGIEAQYTEDETLNTLKMHAELKERDPKASEKIHPNDSYRLIRALAVLRVGNTLISDLKPEVRSESQSNRLWIKYAVALSRHFLSQAITRRTEKMLSSGLIEETRKLQFEFPTSRALQSIGYHEVCRFLRGDLMEKQLRNEIIEKTRQLAKRQITWLRSDEEVRFVDFQDLDRIKLEIENLQFALGPVQ